VNSILNTRVYVGCAFLFLAGIMIALTLGHDLRALLISIMATVFFFLIFLIDRSLLRKDTGVG